MLLFIIVGHFHPFCIAQVLKETKSYSIKLLRDIKHEIYDIVSELEQLFLT